MAAKNQAKIDELLTKGVANIYPDKKFLEDKLKSGKPLTLYLGIDPTGPELHLGHAIPLMKLKSFQDLGHHVILLMGNFTALSGDPDKGHTRQKLTKKEVDNNLKGYKKQAAKILSFSGKNPAQIKFNYNWLAKLNFKDIIDIASNFTVQNMLTRDLFAKRLSTGSPIYLHEFLYPLMQAYDSLHLDIDGEIGGNDQTFNMLAGRDLMSKMKKKEKFVLTIKLLEDPSGKKMGKTENNMITLSDSPQNMFGKVMSWPDQMIALGFELLTHSSMDQVKQISAQLKDGKVNPRDLKAQLASQIVSTYYSKNEAAKASKEFDKIFRDKNTPDDMATVYIMDIEYDLVELMLSSALINNKSEGKRLIEQGGVTVSGKKITDWHKKIKLHDGDILKVGKRKFAELKMK